MGMQFHETGYGKRFFDQQLPALIKALNRMADVYEKKQSVTKHTVYVSYHQRLPHQNHNLGTPNDMNVRLCDTEEALEWAKSLVEKLQNEGYHPVLENALEKFYNDFPYVCCSGIQLRKNNSEDEDEFVLIIEKFFVELEDKR